MLRIGETRVNFNKGQFMLKPLVTRRYVECSTLNACYCLFVGQNNSEINVFFFHELLKIRIALF